MTFNVNDSITFTYQGNRLKSTIVEMKKSLWILNPLAIDIKEQWLPLNTSNHVPFLVSELEDMKINNENNQGHIIIRKAPKTINRKIVFSSNDSSLPKEASENIKQLVKEEIDKNGYKRDKDPFIIKMRKAFRDYGIEPEF